METNWTVKGLIAQGYKPAQARRMIESEMVQVKVAKQGLKARRAATPKEVVLTLDAEEPGRVVAIQTNNLNGEAASVPPPAQKRAEGVSRWDARQERKAYLDKVREYARSQGYAVGPKRIALWIHKEYDEMVAAGVVS